jgi:N6-adenosine-specific RNA methylase IME4
LSAAAKKTFKAHPAADLFPMMTEGELNELAADIGQRGQLEPIITTGNDLVLDGRNRLEACRRAGVDPYMLVWDGDGDPFASPTAFVISMNLRRRHLSESQRGLIGADAEPLFAAEAKTRQQAPLKRGSSKPTPTPPPSAPRGANGKPAAKPAAKGKASEAAARAVGASARSVERAKEIVKKRPEVRELIRQGKKTLGQLAKEIKKDEALKNVQVYRPPVGTYSVIVTDVSWEYDDKLDGSDQARGGVGYASQKLDEILKMKIPAAGDCALWFWVTNQFLMDGTAARVLDAWGFTPKALLTWRKVDKAGNDRLGSGHWLRNNTEHVILAVRGKPLVNGAEQPTIFDAPRTSRHSEKPDRFFEIAEKVTPCAPEARIELFAIEERKGWRTSGSEQQAKARAKHPDARAPGVEADLGPAIIWSPVTKKTVVPGVEVVKGTKYFVERGELGIGKRTTYLLEPATDGRHAGLGIVFEDKKGVAWPGAFKTTEGARAAAFAFERGGEFADISGDFKAPSAGPCGATDGHQGPKNGPCLMEAGHDGPHSNGRRTWRAKKGKPTRSNMQVRDVVA